MDTDFNLSRASCLQLFNYIFVCCVTGSVISIWCVCVCVWQMHIRLYPESSEHKFVLNPDLRLIKHRLLIINNIINTIIDDVSAGVTRQLAAETSGISGGKKCLDIITHGESEHI